MKKLFLSFVCAAFVLAGLPLPAQQSGKFGVAPFPIIAYSPETNLMLGGCAVIYHQNEPGGRQGGVDSLNLAAYYTLNKQYCFSATNQLYLWDASVLVRNSVSVNEAPQIYYGIGQYSPDAGNEEYTSFAVPLSFSVLYRIIDRVYVGPAYNFLSMNMKKTEAGGKLDSNDITGSDGTLASGAGCNAVYDSTRGGLNPDSGYYAELMLLQYHPLLGSVENFTTCSLDLRSYHPLGIGTLCFQGRGSGVAGDVPFYFFPSLGGDKAGLRGVIGDRYKDRCFAMFQSEYRFPLIWRFGMTVFAGAGEVAHQADDFGKHVKVSGGAGLRAMIDETQKINLRLDLACGADGVQTYFQLLESF